MRRFDGCDGGFSLVEVTLALGVMAFCLLAIAGLLPIGLSTHQASAQQTASTDIISSVVTDLRSTSESSNSSPRFGIDIASGGTIYIMENGTPGSQDNSRYRVDVALNPQAGRLATTGRIQVTWPPQQADPAKAAGRVEAFIALDRN